MTAPAHRVRAARPEHAGHRHEQHADQVATKVGVSAGRSPRPAPRPRRRLQRGAGPRAQRRDQVDEADPAPGEGRRPEQGVRQLRRRRCRRGTRHPGSPGQTAPGRRHGVILPCRSQADRRGRRSTDGGKPRPGRRWAVAHTAAVAGTREECHEPVDPPSAGGGQGRAVVVGALAAPAAGRPRPLPRPGLPGPAAVHAVRRHDADGARDRHRRRAGGRRRAGMRTVTEFERIGVVVASGTAGRSRRPAPSRASPTSRATPRSRSRRRPPTPPRAAPRPSQTLTGANGSALDGSGVSVAVIDSGVDPTHPYFQNEDGSSAVVANLKSVCLDESTTSTDCVVEVPASSTPTPISGGGHGTHVNGIVAGRRDHADRRQARSRAPRPAPAWSRSPPAPCC